MQKFWETKRFKELLKIWNEKLKGSGFKDIEKECNDKICLKQSCTTSHNSYTKATVLERETRLEYFRIMGDLSQSSKFPNETDKIVMQKHSEGSPVNEIINEIKFRGKTLDRKTVRHIIRRYQNKWGIRTWNLSQMNLKKNNRLKNTMT